VDNGPPLQFGPWAIPLRYYLVSLKVTEILARTSGSLYDKVHYYGCGIDHRKLGGVATLNVRPLPYPVPMTHNITPANAGALTVGARFLTASSGRMATILRVLDKGTRYQLAVEYVDGSTGWTTISKGAWVTMITPVADLYEEEVVQVG